jgi:hypothetical protein
MNSKFHMEGLLLVVLECYVVGLAYRTNSTCKNYFILEAYDMNLLDLAGTIYVKQ